MSDEIKRLEAEALNPQNAAMAALRQYRLAEDFHIGGTAQVHIASHLVAKLYRRGRTAIQAARILLANVLCTADCQRWQADSLRHIAEIAVMEQKLPKQEGQVRRYEPSAPRHPPDALSLPQRSLYEGQPRQ